MELKYTSCLRVGEGKGEREEFWNFTTFSLSAGVRFYCELGNLKIRGLVNKCFPTEVSG